MLPLYKHSVQSKLKINIWIFVTEKYSSKNVICFHSNKKKEVMRQENSSFNSLFCLCGFTLTSPVFYENIQDIMLQIILERGMLSVLALFQNQSVLTT